MIPKVFARQTEARVFATRCPLDVTLRFYLISSLLLTRRLTLLTAMPFRLPGLIERCPL